VPASGCGTASSRFGPGAGTSRDGWQSTPRLGLKSDDSKPDERSWDFDGR
jgi:hypothetical protein